MYAIAHTKQRAISSYVNNCYTNDAIIQHYNRIYIFK